MAVTIKGATSNNGLEITAAGEVSAQAAVKPVALASQSNTYAAGASGNLTFTLTGAASAQVIIKNSNPVRFTFTIELSENNTDWVSVPSVREDYGVAAVTHVLKDAPSIVTGFTFTVPTAGFSYLRLRCIVNSSAVTTTVVVLPAPVAYTPLVVPAVAAREPVSIYQQGTSATASGTETAFNITRVQLKLGGVTTTSSTSNSHQVNAGKTLRIQSIVFSLTGNTSVATAATAFLRVRADQNVASFTPTTAPVICTAFLSVPATAGAYAQQAFTFPDGLDIYGGTTTAICGFLSATYNASYVTNAPTMSVQINGYEF